MAGEVEQLKIINEVLGIEILAVAFDRVAPEGVVIEDVFKFLKP